MNSPSISDDPDTDKLLWIVVRNLVRWFGYEQAAAEQFMRSFYHQFVSSWGDDFYHHEGAFRTAALMHYSAGRSGSTDFSRFPMWYRTQKFAEAEREALEHFRATYFSHRTPA